MSHSPNDTPTPTPSLGHVDQIREIIVGAQIREFNEQLEALEIRLSDRFESLQKRLEKDHETDVKALTKQVDKLKTALREERSARVQAAKMAAKELRADLKDRTGSLERAKLDRTSLAEVLAGMSDQLRQNGDS